MEKYKLISEYMSIKISVNHHNLAIASIFFFFFLAVTAIIVAVIIFFQSRHVALRQQEQSVNPQLEALMQAVQMIDNLRLTSN